MQFRAKSSLYKSYILIDFARLPQEVRTIFAQDLNDLDLFFSKLSAYYWKPLYRRDSLIIFDEVQRFPAARQLIKYLVADGRYDYLETGSLLSLRTNVENIVAQVTGISFIPIRMRTAEVTAWKSIF